MDQYLLIAFLVGWTSINPSYDLGFTRGTRVLTHPHGNFHHGFWPMDDPIFFFTEEWRSFDLHFCNCPWQKNLASTNLANYAIYSACSKHGNKFKMCSSWIFQANDGILIVLYFWGSILCCTYIVPTWRVKPHEWWSRCRGIWILYPLVN